MPLPDLESLLQPATQEPPCGPDLEYDIERLELEQALSGRPEQQYGSHVIGAVPPDWAQVMALAQRQLLRSKDLRLAVAWTRAATRLHGLEGCAAGLELVLEMMQRFWTDVHPTPDEEGDLWARRLCLEALGHKDCLALDLLRLLDDPDAAHLGHVVADRVDEIDLRWQQLSGEESLDLWRLRDRLTAQPGRAGDPQDADAAQGARGPVAARAALVAALEWIDASAA